MCLGFGDQFGVFASVFIFFWGWGWGRNVKTFGFAPRVAQGFMVEPARSCFALRVMNSRRRDPSKSTST